MARTVGSSAPQTRRRILEAAAEVFAERGYSGASMRDIAERLGITKAALYYHFASKEDLLDGLVEPVMRSLTDFAADAESGRYPAQVMLLRFLDLTIEGIPGLHPLLADPGARAAIGNRHRPLELNRRIETLLSGGADGSADPRRLMCWQYALGGIRSLVITRLLSLRHGPDGRCAVPPDDLGDDEPLFSDDEREVMLNAALAVLGSTAAGTASTR